MAHNSFLLGKHPRNYQRLHPLSHMVTLNCRENWEMQSVFQKANCPEKSMKEGGKEGIWGLTCSHCHKDIS